MYNGIATGHWPVVELIAIEFAPNGVIVTLHEKTRLWGRWPVNELTRRFFKLNRCPRV